MKLPLLVQLLKVTPLMLMACTRLAPAPLLLVQLLKVTPLMGSDRKKKRDSVSVTLFLL